VNSAGSAINNNQKATNPKEEEKREKKPKSQTTRELSCVNVSPTLRMEFLSDSAF
jgi:hypothetical protein